MDPSKLTSDEEAPRPSLPPTVTIVSSGDTSDDFRSATKLLNASDPVPFIVTEALSQVYYKGLPSRPRLIATSNPNPYEEPTVPEAYSVFKELRQLGGHPLAKVWDYGLSEGLRHVLDTLGVNWTSLDALRIAEVGESSTTAIVWIGVEIGALSFEEGSLVVIRCCTLIDTYDIPDYHVEIRESRIMEQAANRFLDPVPLSHPTFAARDPYTATLGIPISAKNRPWSEGTAGFYLSAGGDDKNIYLVTARHIIFPTDNDSNKEYKRSSTSQTREDLVVLGTSGFNEKLAAIDYEIQDQKSAIVDAIDRTKLVEGLDDSTSVTEREEAERDLQKAEKGLEVLKALHHEIVTQWGAKEKRAIGELVWAPPIVLSTEPGQYTLDLAVIKVHAGKLDAKNYRGNSINIGNKYTRQQFMDKVDPHPTNPTSFKFPADRIVALRDQVTESDLIQPPTVDSNGDMCLVVFKSGAKTGLTIGKANNVSSFTRKYFDGQYQESREWPVIPTDRHSGVFSAKGDSGSCVADALSRIGGIINGGTGKPNDTDSVDVTYVTPISFIMDVLHNTTRFAHAHLNPTLT